MEKDFEIVSRNRSFEGEQLVCRHKGKETGTPMRFSVYLPPQSKSGKVPVLYWLSGLTCTDENFTTKSGVQRLAAKEGIAIVAPDTSPRGANLPGESDHWSFGVGAGYYVDATEQPWARYYRMESYVARELPALVAEHFPIDTKREAISGHSMGGHGALVLALRDRERFRSVSAFSPIVSPTRCPWGRHAFTKLLGTDETRWRRHDASLLVAEAGRKIPLLVDQGTADQFLTEQLKPELLEVACAQADHPLQLRRREGYDHSYYFVATFLEEHLAHHGKALRG